MYKLKEKKSLVDGIRKYLLNAIHTLQIKPGEYINELNLIKELGVSRSPIREAIRLLEGEGLIERVANRGVFVRRITSKEIREMFLIRAILESLAAEQAVPNMRESDLVGIENVFNKMEQAMRDRNSKQYVKLNSEFHRSIIKLARNQVLEKVLKALGNQSLWLTFSAFNISESKFMEESHIEHSRIFEALRSRNPKVVAQVIREHIEKGKERVLAFFESAER